MRTLLLAGLVTALTAACGDDSSGPNNPPAGTVFLKDDSFKPPSLTVTAGSTVTWEWKENEGHNVTFQDGQGSSSTQSSGTHQRQFTVAGQYNYRCTIHSSDFSSGMHGSVTVQ